MSGLQFRPRRSKRDLTLNVTSLIDVLFLLLIFFMLTGTFKRVGELELQLPDSSTSGPSDSGDTHQVELVLTEDERLLVDGEPVALPALKRRLASIREGDPSARVMIKAEKGVEHGTVVGILDIVRETGFPGVGIGTQIKTVPGSGNGSP